MNTDTPATPPAELHEADDIRQEILRIALAFSDSGRKEAIRQLADRVASALARTDARLAEVEKERDELLKREAVHFEALGFYADRQHHEEVANDDDRDENGAYGVHARTALALTPDSLRGMAVVPVGELAELRKDGERLDWAVENKGRLSPSDK